MKYLITGGLGFIGENLVKEIKDDYLILDRLSTQNSLQCDISRVLPNLSAQHIIHLASFTDVRLSLIHPSECIKENISGLVNILELARNTNPETISFTSSIGAKSPISPYTASKNACEAICFSYSNSFNLNIKVLRLANIYGPHSTHKQSAIHHFIKCIINKKPLTIYGDGTQTRDFVYVSDVVNAILRGQDGDISTGKMTSINEIVQILNDLSLTYLNYQLSCIRMPVRKAESNVKTISTLENFISIKEGLEKTFLWYLKNGS